MNGNLPTIEKQNTSVDTFVFQNALAFENGQRMATALSKANLVPKEYQGNMPNCLIALEAAQRLKASPLLIMQNLHIIHGRPSWSAQFLIATINSCGRYSPLRFVITKDDKARDINGTKITNITCVAWAIEKETGERLESSEVSLEMAIQEGWYTKNGSKWKTMPEQMLRYRAASFFARIYSPELTMGMQTMEEVQDTGMRDVTPSNPTSTATDLNKEFLDIDTDTGELTTEPVVSESSSLNTHIVKDVEPEKELPVPQIKIGLNDDGTANWEHFADEVIVIVNGKSVAWKNKLIKMYESQLKNMSRDNKGAYTRIIEAIDSVGF